MTPILPLAHKYQGDPLTGHRDPADSGGGLRTSQMAPPQAEGQMSEAAHGGVGAADAGNELAEPKLENSAEQAGGDTSLLDRLDLQFVVDLFDKGGPVVVILFVLSVVALTVVLLKLWQFTRLGVGSGRNVEQAVSLWIAGKRDKAHTMVRNEENPSAVALAHAMAGIAAGAEERIVREDVERVALTELGKLRSYMRVIEATVQLAPLLGLFGTVLGMISAFQALQATGSETDPAVLAGGIWVALLTTAVGLAIAIPAAFVNHWFEGRIEREKGLMEAALTSLFTQRITEVGRSASKSRSRAKLANAAE